MGKTAKVTSKGQVTIPKEIREYLDSEIVEFEIKDGLVTIRAVKRVAGALKGYANTDLISQEEDAWAAAVKNNYENR